MTRETKQVYFWPKMGGIAGVYIFLKMHPPTYEKKYRRLVSWYFLPKILPKWFLELINPCLEYNGVLVPLDPLSRVNWTTLVREPILTKTNRNYSFLIYLYKKVEIYFYEKKKLNRNLRPSAGKRRKSPTPRICNSVIFKEKDINPPQFILNSE